MIRFLTNNIHHHFSIDTMNLKIGFVTISWTNAMAYQYHMPKNHNLFQNQNIL